jgi:hypothetical protein
LVVSPENFTDIFGKLDKSLERKKSYFHRTVINMLSEGPVICLNIRDCDETDVYNWQSFSLTSGTQNTHSRTNSVIDFYNTNDGFWKRDTTILNDLSNEYFDKNTPLTFVNKGKKNVSLLMMKSNLRGFDTSVEDWYNGDYPEYLHPKDWVSDYMIIKTI